MRQAHSAQVGPVVEAKNPKRAQHTSMPTGVVHRARVIVAKPETVVEKSIQYNVKSCLNAVLF